MGLDMFLEATRHIAPYDAQTEPMRRAIGAAIGYVPPRAKPKQDASLMEVSGVAVRVGYWCQCIALHEWFVDNVQEGSDDGRATHVSEKCLRELQRVCERVIDNPPSTYRYFNIEEGIGLDGEELQYTMAILAHAVALQEQGWDISYRGSR
jgi:hypothetical protein